MVGGQFVHSSTAPGPVELMSKNVLITSLSLCSPVGQDCETGRVCGVREWLVYERYVRVCRWQSRRAHDLVDPHKGLEACGPSKMDDY